MAARLTEVAARDPQRIVPYSYAGTMGFVQGDGAGPALFHALGASRLDATICSAAGSNGLASVHGGSVGMSVEQFDHARLILLWGTNRGDLQRSSMASDSGGQTPGRGGCSD